MDTIETLRSRLRARRADWPEICAAADLSIHWLIKLVNGQIAEPSYQKVERLKKCLSGGAAPKSVPAKAA